MKKLLFLLAIGLFCLGPVVAQTMAPSVISSAGGAERTPTLSLEWTLGELAVQSLETRNGLQTEGFHQPVLKVEAQALVNENELAARYDIQIRPNPVRSYLQVNVRSEETAAIQLTLIDLNGKVLIRRTLAYPFDFSALDMEAYPAGLYLLRFQRNDGQAITTFKVSKTR